MNMIELRNRLNKLIEEGKSGYKVYETLEGDYELDHIEEGEIWLRKHPLGSIRRTCMRNEELKNNVYSNLIEKVDNYIEFW